MSFPKLFFVIAFLSFGVACQKEAPEQPSTIAEGRSAVRNADEDLDVTFKFYIDGQEVESIENPEEYRIAATSWYTSPTTGVIKVDAFSTDELYIEFGNEHQLKFDKQLEFEQIMQDYAADRGYLEEGDDEVVPDADYRAFEAQTYQDLLGGNASSRAITWLYKTYFSSSQGNVMPNTLPVMWPGWNNKVKSYYQFAVTATMTMYDRSFYRDHLFTTYNWGFQTISSFWAWNMWWEDRMSCGLSF